VVQPHHVLMLHQTHTIDLEQVGHHRQAIAIREEQQKLARGRGHVQPRGQRVGDLSLRRGWNRWIGQRAAQLGVRRHQAVERREVAFDLDRIGFFQRDVEQGSRVARGGSSRWHRVRR